MGREEGDDTMKTTGTRIISPKKLKLITQADRIILQLTQQGVNVKTLKQLHGIDKRPDQIPTKKWSGIIGALKEFARANGLAVL